MDPDQSDFSPSAGAVAPRRRKAGRPAKLSPALILQASLRILDHAPVEHFMVKTVAGSLGTTSMAIYRYFPSRDALLFAAANEVCRQFKPPAEGATWEETVARWLWAIKRHADRHPMMVYALGLNGRVAPEWVRLTVPLTVLMSGRLGLRGKALTQATYLFGVTVFSMLRVVADNPARHASHLLPRIADVTPDEQEAKVLRSIRLRTLSERDALEALFTQFIAGLERLVQQQRAKTRRVRVEGKQ